jgi:serine/threonine protein kinase
VAVAFQDPLLGSVLDGRYRIVSLLGRGGMGNVYLAEETRLKRRAAIKVLHPHLTQERGNVDRFLREAQTIAQFEHPHIVDIFAYGEEPNGVVFFAMELLSGEDLDARVKASAQRPYTTADVLQWAVQIARAVAVVHDAGLIHRDLKVSNIYLARRRDGEELVKLLDFGIARPEDGSELTATGVALGTPSYMSPEQIESRGVDRRADIYSFGVLLYKLTTGQLPFTGDAIQIAIQHRDVPPQPPTLVAPDAGITPELEQLILKAMAKKPADRFQTMQAVEDALLRIIEVEAPELVAGLMRSARPQTMPIVPISRPVSTSIGPLTPLQNPPQVAETTPQAGPTRTGPTAAMAADPPRSNRTLYLITACSLVGVLVLLAAAMLGGGPAAPTDQKTEVATAPVIEPNKQVSPPDVVKPPDTLVEPTPQVEPPKPPDVATPVATTVDLPDDLPDDPPVVPPTKVDPPATKTRPPPGEVKPKDPIAQVNARAASCRRKHKAVGGPKIAVTYWVGNDGVANDARAATADELGKCLAQAVSQTKFEAKLSLGKRIEL